MSSFVILLNETGNFDNHWKQVNSFHGQMRQDYLSWNICLWNSGPNPFARRRVKMQNQVRIVTICLLDGEYLSVQVLTGKEIYYSGQRRKKRQILCIGMVIKGVFVICSVKEHADLWSTVVVLCFRAGWVTAIRIPVMVFDSLRLRNISFTACK